MTHNDPFFGCLFRKSQQFWMKITIFTASRAVYYCRSSVWSRMHFRVDGISLHIVIVHGLQVIKKLEPFTRYWSIICHIDFKMAADFHQILALFSIQNYGFGVIFVRQFVAAVYKSYLNVLLICLNAFIHYAHIFLTVMQ